MSKPTPRLRARARFAVVAVYVTAAVTPVRAGDAVPVDRAEAIASIGRGSSTASIAGAPTFYTADGYHFSDIDGDGEQEFITMEDTESYPKERIATVSRWLPGTARNIEWMTAPLHRIYRMLVGNIDEDPLDEVVLFGEGTFRSPGETTLHVVDWHAGAYRVFESAHLSGRAGALLDVDGDGVKEIVLAKIREKIREAEGTDPVTLMIVDFDGGFETTFERALPHGVLALGGGDLDGDGRDEIVTEEASFDGDVRGQLSIYHVDPQLGVERRFRRNGYLEHINFLRVFRTDGIPYLVIDSGRRALSVFRFVPSSRGHDLVAQRLDRFELFWEAIRTTMAYIAEDQAYIRFDDELNPEVVPTADFRAPMPVDVAR